MHLEAPLYDVHKANFLQQFKHKTKLLLAVNMELGCSPTASCTAKGVCNSLMAIGSSRYWIDCLVTFLANSISTGMRCVFCKTVNVWRGSVGCKRLAEEGPAYNVV